ncbi:MAG: alpha/beta hydrolase family protein [Terriglobales bacterium]
MYRTRFRNGIVAEFLPPARRRRHERLILLCDGMPSMPRKQGLAAFLAERGYWVIYPRWRGAWESSGRFLALPPQQDLSDILDELPRGLRECAFGERFTLNPERIFVIGGSFGGAAALLAALDPRVAKIVATCPVVDWSILDEEQPKETSNPSYVAYIREAFGEGYRLSERSWNKLRNGRFFNPLHELTRMDASKIMMFHAQDDPYVPWRSVAAFAKAGGFQLRLLRQGGHLSTDRTVRRFWPRIERFFSA